MALYLSRADIQQFASMPDAMEVLEKAFARWDDPYAFNLERRRMPRKNDKELNILAGVAPGGEMLGVRASGVRFNNIMMLFSESMNGLAAVIECGPISEYRTGAASGVATKYLARENAHTVGVIGAGRTAWPQLEAVCVARQIDHVKVFARNEDNRNAFARKTEDTLKIKATAVASAESAVADCDIVIVATSSAEPVLFGKWLKPGMHVNAIGANNLERREIDDDVVLRANLVAIDHRDQGKIEAGAIESLVQAGKYSWDKVSELGEIVQGQKPKRTSDSQITLFHSLGLGFEDIVYAEAIYARAKAAGLGKQLG